MADDPNGPWSGPRTTLLISGSILFLAGAGQIILRLLMGVTGSQLWLWLVIGGVQAVCGGVTAGGVVRDRRRIPRPPKPVR